MMILLAVRLAYLRMGNTFMKLRVNMMIININGKGRHQGLIKQQKGRQKNGKDSGFARKLRAALNIHFSGMSTLQYLPSLLLLQVIDLMYWLFRHCCDKETPPQPIRKQIKITVTPPPNESLYIHPTFTPVLSKRDSSSFGELSRIIKKDRYEGQELDGQPHGNGSMLYANGDFYRGEWVNGKKQGRGLQIYQELNVQYEGEWQNDQPYGNGKITEQNSSYYLGEFKNGVKWGKGQYYDCQKKTQFQEYYSNGILKQQKEIVLSKSKEEDFPTLVLDKERFTTEDLNIFEQTNPHIKELQVMFLLKYYGLCKIGKLECISKNLKEWTIKEVLNFLDLIELRDCKENFYQNKIKGKDLLTLTEREMKEDLKMKMGHRKRFLNYRMFLASLDANESKQVKDRKKSKNQSYKFRSATSMKNALRTVKNYAMYEESIQQQSSQSQKESQKFHTNQMFKVDAHYSPQHRQYDSEAIQQRHSLMNSNPKQSSLEKLIDPQSQRSSRHSKERSSKSNKRQMRKDSKEYEQSNPSNHLILAANKNNGENKHKSDEQAAVPREEELKSSTDSSSQDLPDLCRKRTYDKSSHQSTQIRQLYEFLKQHRGLEFLIRQKDIQKLQLIGQGGFGKVYKGKYIGQLIAIKDYLKTGKHRHKQDFMKELQIISDLKHPNIVLYMGMCITANKYTLITEYLQNGSLFDQLHKKKKKFTPFEQIQILFDIVKGMVYLHNMKKILHRDLKSSNVLIGENWQVKLCDFGLSGQKKKGAKKNKNRLGTFQWMAPEVIRNQQKIDEFADVYSFGVIIWQLLSEKIPYQGLSQQQIIGLVGYDEDHQLQAPHHGCQFINTIMRKCLRRTQNQRPTFIDIQTEFQSYYAFSREKNP